MSDEAVRQRVKALAGDPPPSVIQALATVKTAVGAVRKTERNTAQGYDFRGIDAVVNAAAPHLNEQGVVIVPVLKGIEYTTVNVGRNQTPMAHVQVRVNYRFYGPAGDWLDTEVPGESMDSGDKATAKAMSVAYRIALLQALNLPTDERDPDASTYERSPEVQLASKGQLLQLLQLLKGLGHGERSDALSVTERLVGHGLANNPANLTAAEAGELNEVLSRCNGDAARLDELLGTTAL